MGLRLGFSGPFGWGPWNQRLRFCFKLNSLVRVFGYNTVFDVTPRARFDQNLKLLRGNALTRY